MNRNTKQWLFIGIGIAVVLIAGIGYRLGFGTLSMIIPLSNTSIFINNINKAETSKENETVIIVVSPTKHSIIVSKINYFPWMKNFTMPSNGKISLSPIFISQNASGQMINQNDPEYWSLKYQVEKNALPTRNSPLISKDEKVRAWIEGNTIMTDSGSTTPESLHTVIQPNTVVNNLSFYKDRNDALIFSTGDSVNMIEIDTENNQNFMPIYRGENPRFIQTDPNFIYVVDGKTLMQVVI